ncbi:DUF2125 domain-containing protein [Roseovarius spongiae]|uniref:DUF2125 domain-containing protein n=1 Tax=Roseovarius spongiae TaxID=2320272 RepID=A0A3A8B493_9RHOB|nr:DUF2125 domain-containing protein [Roseovarius spongiae]RKF12950.1 DUF2125 domain-containing protein [Roseovarius spongiae]
MNTLSYAGGLAAAAAIAISGSAALADVSAQQVWDDWEAYMEGFGYDVTATESARGDGLTVSDIVMSMTVPEDDITVEIAMSEISFIDNGDGAVSIQFPSPLPVSISATGSDPFEVTLDYVTSGWDMVAAGDADDIVYTYSADSAAMELTGVGAEGQTIDIGEARIEMTDVEGESRVTQGNLRKIVQRITSGPVSYSVDITNPDDAEARIVANGRTDSLAMNSTVAVPPEMDFEEMGAAIDAGFSGEGGYEFGPGESQFSITEAGKTTQGATSSEGGAFGFSMADDGLDYNVGVNGLNVEFAGGDIPFPVAMAMKEAVFNLTMPVAESEESQDFGLKLVLGDFTMSDMIWGIFDPAGKLPRDPATVAFDLAGQAKLFLDLLDPEQIEAAEESGEMPGELETMTLNDLTVRLIGAELTGAGDLTFDNSDTESYDGLPKPVGTVNLNMTGANALLDKLVEMGFVPQDQAMGARMMMGLFAVPGDGDDALKSKIEFTEEGQILANGQRLK